MCKETYERNLDRKLDWTRIETLLNRILHKTLLKDPSMKCKEPLKRDL